MLVVANEAGAGREEFADMRWRETRTERTAATRGLCTRGRSWAGNAVSD